MPVYGLSLAWLFLPPQWDNKSSEAGQETQLAKERQDEYLLETVGGFIAYCPYSLFQGVPRASLEKLLCLQQYFSLEKQIFFLKNPPCIFCTFYVSRLLYTQNMARFKISARACVLAAEDNHTEMPCFENLCLLSLLSSADPVWICAFSSSGRQLLHSYWSKQLH